MHKDIDFSELLLLGKLFGVGIGDNIQLLPDFDQHLSMISNLNKFSSLLYYFDFQFIFEKKTKIVTQIIINFKYLNDEVLFCLLGKKKIFLSKNTNVDVFVKILNSLNIEYKLDENFTYGNQISIKTKNNINMIFYIDNNFIINDKIILTDH